MKRVIIIEGMHCDHCKTAVENALNSIDGVTAKVNLKKNQATVTLTKEVSNQVLTDAIKEEDFSVVSIADKEGIFG